MKAFISSNIWWYKKKLKETFEKTPFRENDSVYLIHHHRLSLSICSVSLFPHTVRLCEAEGKELAVSCQQRRHQKGLFGRSWGAGAHRIAAGITQGEMLLLQGWFRTIMEELCGGFAALTTLTHIKHTYGAHWRAFIKAKHAQQHSMCWLRLLKKYCNMHIQLGP